jgi:hypothetical protein
MIAATTTNLETLARFLDITPQMLETVLWGVLIAGLAFSILHLLTMLVTRWGDSNAMSKSLIFSVLVHVSCTFGLVAVSPPMSMPEQDPEERDQTVLIHEFLLEAEEKVETEQSGNTPVFQKLSEVSEVKPTRGDRTPLEPQQLANPERQPKKPIIPEENLSDHPSLPNEPVVTATITRQGDAGPRLISQIPLKIDEQTAEKRPEVQIPAPTTNRSDLVRSGDSETPVTRENRPKLIDRVDKEIDSSSQLASVDIQVSPKSFLKRAPVKGTIRRRQGPVPSLLPEKEVGSSPNKPMQGTAGTSPGSVRISRQRTQTILSHRNGSTERFRPERTPQIPRPDPGQKLSVRKGSPAFIPRPGLKPNLMRQNLARVSSRKSTILPEAYRSRDSSRQIEAIRKYGGTEESQRAVELSLKWLALHQRVEGYWDADRHEAGQVRFDELGVDRRNAGKFSDTGVTALALLAFLAKGYTHEEGRYADQVDRALRWLVQQQRQDGFLGGEAVHHARMYCHAMATFALAEAYGMQTDPVGNLSLREPLEKAVKYILDNQNPIDGGWRYLKGQKSDMSMFGWQLMALNRAEVAGLTIPRETGLGMVSFLKSHSRGEHGGLFSYQDGYRITPVMTAEALFCKQVFRIPRDDRASIEAVEYLMQNLPKRSQTNVYYWYYGTLALFNFHGEQWREWNKAMHSVLLSEQHKDGDDAGSWDPIGPWGRYGGRVYSTALSTLCLEVYFRDPPRYANLEEE